MTETVRIATLNLRNRSDRWNERAPMVIEQIAELLPDVIGLQEISVPIAQGKWIVDRVNGLLPEGSRPYVLHQVAKAGWKSRWEAIGVKTRLEILGSEAIDLRGGHRVAVRVRLRAPDGRPFDVYNTHLHHATDAGALRLAQAVRILEWMAMHDDVPSIFVGDLNATPGSPPIAAVGERMRSAYALVHGREPEGTVPAPVHAEWGGTPKTIDYIFVDDRVRVHDARLAFHARHATDERLSASDHYGLAADVSFLPPRDVGSRAEGAMQAQS